MLDVFGCRALQPAVTEVRIALPQRARVAILVPAAMAWVHRTVCGTVSWAAIIKVRFVTGLPAQLVIQRTAVNTQILTAIGTIRTQSVQAFRPASLRMLDATIPCPIVSTCISTQVLQPIMDTSHSQTLADKIPPRSSLVYPRPKTT